MIIKSKKGTSLVESLLAILLIAIVALGGAAFIFFSTSRVNMERNKRVALEVANARLEELRETGFAAVEPAEFDGYSEESPDEEVYIKRLDDGTWDDGDDETININGVDYHIRTIVKYDDPDNPGDYNHLFVEVSVNYRLADPSAVVTLTTYIPSFS